MHERPGAQLGSDGESIEASPCTSDEVTSPDQYQVSVKMRAKNNRTRWSEVCSQLPSLSAQKCANLLTPGPAETLSGSSGALDGRTN